MQTIGERIKAVRKDAGLTQTAFAEVIGIKQNSIALIESGKNTSEQTIKSICREFCINYDWLANGVEPMKMPADEARKGKVERVMQGGNEFVKFVFEELADLPADAWEEIESFIDRWIAKKEGR